ncbi:hypothetical protein BDK62_13012 [Halomonas alkaliantarctica]|nr:hypothetical protein BDK62_13012 [Halomonas alkaliantarctica]
MSKKTYPRPVLQPFISPRALPVIVGGFPLQPADFREEGTQLLADWGTEQDALLAPLENTKVHRPGTWRAMGSMA